jgi:tetratricopeptide (TPR) repeat protein
MAGCLEEQCFQINGDQTISLPEYVGQLRAMRELDSQIAVQLSQMRPRYNQFNWEQEWRNWRLKGLQTLQTSIRNQSLLTASVLYVETPPIVITITGSNDDSSNIIETLTMDATSKTTVNTFNAVASIIKDRVNTYNVSIVDIDGRTLTKIPNNKLQCKYQIVDISLMPFFIQSTSPTNAWVEVLYKKALPWFQNDADEFPAIGYDNVWVNKALQLWAEEQGKAELAIGYYQKAMTLLAAIHEDANRGTADTVALVENEHDRMLHRIGFGRDWRFAYRISGR